MSERPMPREIRFAGEDVKINELKKAIDTYFEEKQKDGISENDRKRIWESFSDKYKRTIKRTRRDGGVITPEKSSQIATELLSEARTLVEGLAQEKKESLSPELLNRYGAEQEFLRRVEKAKKDGDVVVLVTFDLDGFKTINDTIGHTDGDNFLKELAEKLNTSIRPEDIGIRFSGDEFGVLMSVPEEQKDNIKTFVERIVHKVETAVKRPDKTNQEMSTGYIIVENDEPDNENFFENSRKKSDKGSEVSKLIKIQKIINGEVTTSKDRVVSSDKTEGYFEDGEKEKLAYVRQVMRPMREVLKNKPEQEIVEAALQCYEKLVEKK